MKWWGWILLGLVLGAVATYLVVASLASSEVEGYKATLAAERVLQAARDSSWKANEAAMNLRVRQAVDEAQRLRGQLADSGRKVESLHTQAVHNEEVGKEAVVAALTLVDRNRALQEVVKLADNRAGLAEIRLSLATQDVLAAEVIIAAVRDSNATLASQFRQEQKDRLRWQGRADSAGKALGAKAKRWLLNLPKPGWHVTAGVSACPARSLCLTAGYGF